MVGGMSIYIKYSRFCLSLLFRLVHNAGTFTDTTLLLVYFTRRLWRSSRVKTQDLGSLDDGEP